MGKKVKVTKIQIKVLDMLQKGEYIIKYVDKLDRVYYSFSMSDKVIASVTMKGLLNKGLLITTVVDGKTTEYRAVKNLEEYKLLLGN